MYYAYHMGWLWPEFVAEGTAGLNFCTYTLSADEVDEFIQKISEDGLN